MPWSQTTPMHQRTLFIADHLRGSRSVTELCADYGISRKTGYMWIDRYIRRGPAGLEDRSRRPRRAQCDRPRDRQRARGAAASTSDLGRKEAAQSPGASTPGLEVARSIRDLRTVEATWTRAAQDSTTRDRSSRAAEPAHPRAESRVVCRLQGPVSPGRRSLLLPADRHRRRQPLPARLSRSTEHRGDRRTARVSATARRARTAAVHSHR